MTDFLTNSNLNTFEAILAETKLRRKATSSNLVLHINIKIKNYYKNHAKYPTKLFLGREEFEIFPFNFKFITEHSEIIILLTELIDEEDSKIAFTNKIKQENQ